MKYLVSLILILAGQLTYGQDDLLNLLDEKPKEKEYVSSSFKGTRVILGHSTKMRAKKELEFLIAHRFGRINQGAHEFWGLDQAWIRLGLSYGITDNLNVGVGRNSFDKTIDSFLKYRLVRQSEGPGSFPFTVVIFNAGAIKTTPKKEDDPSVAFTDRLSTAHQLLISRKISNSLTLQVMPTYIFKNTVDLPDQNENIALGVGGRLKVTSSIAITSEYYYRLDPPETNTTNSFSIGCDIETGGHVFQLFFTNSIMTLERSFITETFDDFFDGDIHFGFNISRTFQLGGKSKEW